MVFKTKLQIFQSVECTALTVTKFYEGLFSKTGDLSIFATERTVMKFALIFIIMLLSIACRTPKSNETNPNNPLPADTTRSGTLVPVDYYEPDRMEYANRSYDSSIRSVQLHGSEWAFSPPVIFLNKANTLTLTFDLLSDQPKDYYYTFILCDAAWQPVDMPQMDVIEGFFEDRIEDYDFSRNTLIPYIHYSLTFPQEEMKPKMSGNYVLKVWCDQNGSQQTVITRRFYVSEQAIGIQMEVKKNSNPELRDYQHEVDFLIQKSGLDIVDPYRNLTVIVQQNGRNDNQIGDLKPKLVKGDELDYNFESGNIFDAVNEFRHFDIKSLTYYTDRLAQIEKRDGVFHVTLKTDYRRPFERYISEDDVNGRFLIKNDDGGDTDLESEYVWVHFFLSYDAPLDEGAVYLLGGFTQWDSEAFKLNYNYEKRGYGDSLLLKQGYYNYHYAFLKSGSKVFDEHFVEGRHAEADNDYTIYVYYREPGEINDRLIGIQTTKSAKGL